MRCRSLSRPLGVAAATAALALGVSACGGSSGSSSGGGGGGESGGSVPGVTADTVTVGGHFPLTGPAAPGYSEIPPAIDAYFQWVNAHGGINGRKLKFIARDDAYNPTQTVKVTKQLILQDHIYAMVGGLGTPTHTKVVDYLNAQKVPDLFVSSGCRCWDEPQQHPYTFGWLPDYVREGKILGNYVKENFPGKKVAYFYQNDDFGKDGVMGLDKYLKDQVVARESYEPGNTDIGPQMSAIAKSGADVVVMFTIPAYTALAQLASVQLDYHPQFVVSNVGTDPTTVGGLLKSFSKGKAGSSLIEGMISDFYLPSVDDKSNSWTKLFQKVHDKYMSSDIPLDGNVEYGMALAYTFAQALQDAGKNPTRDGIVQALETQQFKGPALLPYAYSADSHAGVTGVKMAKIENGKFVLFGQPMTTDDGDGPIQPYTGGHPEAPADGIPPQG